MKMKFSFFLIFLTVFSSTQISANLPLYFWDNQEGFVKGDQCSFVETTKTKFKVSQYTGKLRRQKFERLRSRRGKRSGAVLNGSLIKAIAGRRKKSYSKIEIVGINKKMKHSIRWTSKRGRKGYLYNNSLRSLDDYIIKIRKGVPKKDLGSIMSSVAKTYWQLATTPSMYQMKCNNMPKKRKYITFKVYSSKKILAVVGVYWDETKIFRSIETIKRKRVKASLSHIILRDDINLSSTNINSEVPRIDDKTRAKIEAIIIADLNTNVTRKDQEEKKKSKVKGELGHKICSGFGRVNLRDGKLRKKGKAIDGEEVKIFQGWGTNIKKKIVDGRQEFFIKIQFIYRESEDKKNAWISKRFVKRLGDCKISKRPRRGSLSDAKKVSEISGNFIFPTRRRPSPHYTTGMRRFGARRAGGRRRHKANDIYGVRNDPILSIGDGRVVKAFRYFYRRTYAINIYYPKMKKTIVYGEITGKRVKGLSLKRKVKKGNLVGYMGKVWKMKVSPMLHFELRRGVNGRAVDPKKMLLKLEKKSLK